jgi:thioredoxin reductase (NADPH)
LALAVGTRPILCEAPGIAALAVRGRAHSDARPLPPNLQGEQVAVLGGGEAAADAALNVAARGADVALFVRGQTLKAAPALFSEVVAAKLPIRLGWKLLQAELNGDGLRLSWRSPDGPRETSATRLLVAIGRERRDELLRQLGLPPAAASGVETTMPGLFVAGDMIAAHERFTAMAMGDGQRAARLAARFLEANNHPGVGTVAPATTLG